MAGSLRVRARAEEGHWERTQLRAMASEIKADTFDGENPMSADDPEAGDATEDATLASGEKRSVGSWGFSSNFQ